MHRFLIAFVCLSTLAMAQNVVVATPLSADSALAISATSETNRHRLAPTAALLGDELPEPTTMMLLIAGLSGLTAVGGRDHDRKKRASTQAAGGR